MAPHRIFLSERLISGGQIKLNKYSFWPALALTLSLPCSAAVDEEAVSAALNQRIEELLFAGDLQIRGADIAARELLSELYARRDFKPEWTSDAKVAELMALLETASAHGLDPQDYFVDELRAIIAAQDDTALARADRDILLTESLIRFGYHRLFGRVNNRNFDPNMNFGRKIVSNQDPETTIQMAIDGESLQAFFDRRVPSGPLYRALQKVLVEYRAIESAGGWPLIPAGETLRKGDTDFRNTLLRERLSITGDLPGDSYLSENGDLTPDVFDDALEQGVIAFQLRHDLGDDGVVGKNTVAAMNVPVQERIDQLRLSLERLRWVSDEVSDKFVAVNIAGFRVFVIRDGQYAWVSRAMVGKTYRQTPVFRGDIRYLVLNPTWTVPPGILRNDILPAVKRDPGYLKARNISVIDRAGKRVDPDTVDWQAYSTGIPYTLRQEPGPNNALGLVKFIFPNEHFVFLHDTPSRGLFGRTDRAFSSGCIRVENPLDLAEILLDDPDQWGRDVLGQKVASRQTLRVNLKEPMPVLILYLTANIDPEGHVRFMKDVYDRDARLLDALNEEVVIEIPDQA